MAHHTLNVLPQLGEWNEERKTVRGKFHITRPRPPAELEESRRRILPGPPTFCGLHPDSPTGRWMCGGAIDWDDPSYFEGRICKTCLRLTTDEDRRN